MLRGEKEVALNEVLVTCQKAADHCAQAAELAEDPAMVERFRHMSNRRRTDAREIERLVRELGYRPGEPHGDKQDLSKMATLVRQAVTADEGRGLIAKTVGLETDLQAAVDGALELKWDPAVSDRLRRLGHSSRDHRRELDAV